MKFIYMIFSISTSSNSRVIGLWVDGRQCIGWALLGVSSPRFLETLPVPDHYSSLTGFLTEYWQILLPHLRTVFRLVFFSPNCCFPIFLLPGLLPYIETFVLCRFHSGSWSHGIIYSVQLRRFTNFASLFGVTFMRSNKTLFYLLLPTCWYGLGIILAPAKRWWREPKMHMAFVRLLCQWLGVGGSSSYDWYASTLSSGSSQSFLMIRGICYSWYCHRFLYANGRFSASFSFCRNFGSTFSSLSVRGLDSNSVLDCECRSKSTVSKGECFKCADI